MPTPKAIAYLTLAAAYFLASIHVNHEFISAMMALAYLVIAIKYLRNAIKYLVIAIKYLRDALTK